MLSISIVSLSICLLYINRRNSSLDLVSSSLFLTAIQPLNAATDFDSYLDADTMLWMQTAVQDLHPQRIEGNEFFVRGQERIVPWYRELLKRTRDHAGSNALPRLSFYRRDYVLERASEIRDLCD
jgi:hypothetical protein